MSSEKTRAIVIRRVEFSESSYVATLFTEDFGKITGLAKGARRPKSSFENALDLLAVSRVLFLRKSSGSMELLTEARLERRFRAGSRDLKRLYAGYYVAELLMALTDERDPHPDLFRIALDTLTALDGEADVSIAVLRFEMSLLRELGHLPELGRCVECGRTLGDRGRVAFGMLAGGTLCEQCKVGQRHVVSLSVRAVEAMRALASERWSTDAKSAADTTPWDASKGELRGLMNQRMSHLLGRRPRMYPFLLTLR